jgi:hypothetical protein
MNTIVILYVRRNLKMERSRGKFYHVGMLFMRNVSKYGYIEVKINFAQIAEVTL